VDLVLRLTDSLQPDAAGQAEGPGR
jgi:hypothetical protein